MYFELIKEKSLIGNGSTGKYYNNMDESVKLPMIRSNITSKYHYPIIEKYDPSTSIYDIIKKMLDEHNHLSKIANNQQKKIDWEEFKDLNGYQIYTLLSLNRVINFLNLLRMF